MATKWTSPTWRMPEESNQSKFENYSLDFDGSGEKIDLGDSDIFSFGDGSTDSPFSFFIWAKFGNITTNCFMAKQTTGTSNSEYGFTQSGDTIETTFAEGVGTRTGYLVSSTTVSPSLITGQWYHIGFTYAGGSNPSTGSIIYVNGVAQSMSYTVSSYTAMSNNSAPVLIGELSGSVGTYNFNGDLAQGCFFGYELTQSQISYLYNSGTPQNPIAIPGNAPIAYYPLGGSSTGDAASSPSTLTVPNESVPSATVLNFDGTNNISFASANTGPLNDIGTGNFTVGIWANAVSNSNYRTLIGNYGTSGLLMWKKISSNVFECYVGSDLFTTTYVIPFDNTWHHYLITRSGTDVTLYVDSIKRDEATGTSSSSLASSLISYIGDQPNSSRRWKGELSNAQIWNTNLLASEITTLYNYGSPLSGTQPQAANLKAWYKMGIDTSNWDGSNWIIGNSTANYSTALDLDGSNDYINLSNSSLASSLSGLTQFTLSLWYNQDAVSNKFLFDFKDGTNRIAFQLVNASTNFLYFNSSNNAYSASDTPTQQWNNFVLVFDGSQANADRIKVYINNSKITASSTGTIDAALGSFSASSIFNLGATHAATQTFNGIVSNLSLFNTALNPTDLYNNGTPQASISGSPLAWWKLDNTTITDSSNNGYTGTNVGATQVSSLVSTLNGTSSGMTTANLVNSDLTRSIPYSSYSMSLNGTSDYIKSSYTLPASTTTFSASMWVNTASLSTLQGLIGSQDSSSDGYWVSISSNNINFKINGTTSAASTSSLSANTWFNLVVTYDGSTAKIYINNNTPVSNSVTETIDVTADTIIGRLPWTGFYFLNGSISNVAIWDSLLNQDQVLTIYNGGVPNDISSLSPVGWWSLAGDSYYNGTDWIFPDLSSNSNNGDSNGTMGGDELIGNGPGSTGNGTATGMNIPANLQGNAPNSTKNAFSINMTADDKTSSVPDISS